MHDTPTHLFIAVPLHDGKCAGTFAVSFVRAVLTLRNAGVRVTYQFLEEGGNTIQARNTVAHLFLQSPATHLLFLDSDIAFSDADLVRFIQWNRPVVTGFYPKREINWNRVGQAYQSGIRGLDLARYSGYSVITDPFNPLLEPGAPMEVTRAGGGFMLIERRVLATLKTVAPECAVIIQGQETWVAEFFAAVRTADNSLSPEDAFCRRVRNTGMSVWADPRACFTRTGPYTFSGVAQP